MEIRHFGKVQEIVPVPSLVELQAKSYDAFFDVPGDASKRGEEGLNGLLAEFFPIEGYDGKIKVSYHGYSFSPPQHDEA